MNHGDLRQMEGKTRACDGGTHVLPVPNGMTVDSVIAELMTFGRLVEPPVSDDACEWAVTDCDGQDDCWCQFVDLAADFKAYYNDVQIWPPTTNREG